MASLHVPWSGDSEPSWYSECGLSLEPGEERREERASRDGRRHGGVSDLSVDQIACEAGANAFLK